MKIIAKDNYDRETVSDRLIAENVTEHWGKLMVNLLNNHFPHDGDKFFMLVPDDHKLYQFEP